MNNHFYVHEQVRIRKLVSFSRIGGRTELFCGSLYVLICSWYLFGIESKYSHIHFSGMQLSQEESEVSGIRYRGYYNNQLIIITVWCT